MANHFICLFPSQTDLNGAFKDAGALGNFAENHDQPRWLLDHPDVTRYQNALAVAFFLPGVCGGFDIVDSSLTHH